jgi:hypothetical protein
VLYTPLGASWLNMSESMQRILARRASEGHHPKMPEEIIDRLEAAARGWNREPTPFEWGGRRAARRESALVGDAMLLWEEAELAQGGRSGDTEPSWRNGDTRVK